LSGNVRRSKVAVVFFGIKRRLYLLLFLALALVLTLPTRDTMGDSPVTSSKNPAPPSTPPASEVYLGEQLFNDVNLSNPPGQSCASCHGQYAGFKFPLSKINVQSGIAPGAFKGRFGNRIPPTISYAAYLQAGPPAFNGVFNAFSGGLFWDGRVNTLTDQAKEPFVNPNEMNNLLHNLADPATVVRKVQDGPNAWLFRKVYGNLVFSQGTAKVYNLIAQSIAAFESSPEISPFSSKYDAFVHGEAVLSQSEWNGLRLMTGSVTGRPGGLPYYKNANCSDCHGILSDPTDGVDLWTNSCFDNIGTPKNPENPYYAQTNASANPAGYNPQGAAYVDLGLGGTFYPTLGLPPGNIGPGSNGQGDYFAVNGSFKAPTLRNVDKRPRPGFVKRYTHNGYFTDLKTIVHFYNTRNLTTCPGEVIDFTQPDPYAHLKGKPLWPPPEWPNPTTLQNPSGAPNSSGAQVGNLGLTAAEEDDIVAMLKALSDGYTKSYAGALPTPAQAAARSAAQSAKVSAATMGRRFATKMAKPAKP
jgi:cytochrome c peroxidase